MKLCILIFGQFRSFQTNLENNLREINDVFLKGNEVDVYLLTDKNISGNYFPKKEKRIIELFKRFNCNIQIRYWEDLTQFHFIDKQKQEEYLKNRRTDNIRLNFTMNMWYRRFLTNEFRKAYGKGYDLCLFFRPFDTIIRKLKPNEEILKSIQNAMTDNTVYLSFDTFIYCNPSTIDKVFEMTNSRLFHDEDIWDDKDLCNFFKDNDSYLYHVKPTYCSEVQLISYMYHNDIKFKNVRIDITNDKTECNKDSLFYIIHNKFKFK